MRHTEHLSLDEAEEVFEGTYDLFLHMFSHASPDKGAFIKFMRFVVSTLESGEDVIETLFPSFTLNGQPRFNNVDMPEETLWATIIAEERQTAKQILVFFNELKKLKQDCTEESISGLASEARAILRKLEARA